MSCYFGEGLPDKISPNSYAVRVCYGFTSMPPNEYTDRVERMRYDERLSGHNTSSHVYLYERVEGAVIEHLRREPPIRRRRLGE